MHYLDRYRDPDARRAYVKAWRAANKEHLAEQRRAAYWNNHERSLANAARFAAKQRELPGYSDWRHKRWLRNQYGLSAAEYADMLAAQNGVCAICGKVETATWRGKVRRLAVDHSHATNLVRALLCARCNTMLRLVDDDSAVLQLLIDYLERGD
jgi:hypothetical protein